MRIIPTGVGKSCKCPGRCQQSSDHPHGRGEKPTQHFLAVFIIGSSPRAWGKGFPSPSTKIRVRIIPTGVGKRSLMASSFIFWTDHPHGRGEKYHYNIAGGWRVGSSPRAWGKVITLHFQSLHTRIIPTGVGKRNKFQASTGESADHPHGRGEKCPDFCYECDTFGSSPRAWGKEGMH